MKILSVFSFLFILINCTAAKIVEPENLFVNGKCIENLDYKKTYFHHITKIDNLIYKFQNEEFKKSLQFISKYNYVDWASMANYARIYPAGAYEKDRKGWILWYDLKKCSNIQFKK